MTNRESFGAELKKRRLEKQVSLMDISAVTRINVKFLEAIEEGKFSVLPQAYVRAFLREYADTVGLDPADVLQQFASLEENKPAPAAAKPQPPPEPPAPPRRSSFAVGARMQMIILVVLLAVVVVLAVVVFRPGPEQPVISQVEEIPFDKVVEESMAALPPPQSAAPATVQPAPAQPDTMVLHMQTTDSVWLVIVIDGARTEEFLFPPNRRYLWRGTQEFSLTLGNAGGATFRLNDRAIGTLGRPGAVVRNVPITRRLLEQSGVSQGP